MLHIVNKSPFERDTLEICLQHALPGSPILLIEDAVYAAMRGTSKEAMVRDGLKNHPIHVLASDLKARGIDEAKVIDGVKLVDYADFVDLVVNNGTTQSWL